MYRRKIFVTGTRGIPYIMGGVESHCEELFPRIVDLGYDVTVLRRDKYVKKDVDCAAGVKNGLWKGVKLVDVSSPDKKSLEAIVHTFRAINRAKSMGAEILHIHAIGPALLTPYARLRGLKVVFTHHGPDYDRDKWGWAAKMMLKLGERMACEFANQVIVISDVIKNLIATRYGRTNNVHLIYNGVPEPEICSMPEYFNELNIEEGKYVLGMCRFVPEKRLHDLIRAFDIAKRNLVQGSDPVLGSLMKDVKLVLAGDTDFEDDYSLGLKAQARESGVVLTGFVKGRKLHSLLSHAICYSLPSSHEGLPIALLEAMSYHLPVITSAIPANLEVGLDPDCYYKVGDVTALADKLETICRVSLKCLTNSETAFRKQYDMRKYDWGVISREVVDVYEQT